MATMIPWPEIEGFHNIRKYASAHPEILNGSNTVFYKAKVKLHGTNAAVQLPLEGPPVCQSRESIITPEKDNAGFARWATEAFAGRQLGMIIYGEWIGPGIQKGVAVSEIPKKSFAVFAARFLEGSYSPDQLIIEPSELEYLVKDIPDAYVLPWFKPAFTTAIDWTTTAEVLTRDVGVINDWVNEVEANDPWVESVFGVKGTGEGLVFYPVSAKHLGFPESEKHLGYENFKNLVFKAKGEKHKNIKGAAPAQVDPSVAAGIDSFVEMVLTEARLEQGATKVSADGALTYDMKQTGKFVTWVVGDVEKETQDELAASNLTFKQVQKAVSDKARAWYITKAKAL